MKETNPESMTTPGQLVESSLAPEPSPRRIIRRYPYSAAKHAGRPLALTPDIIKRAYYACTECGANLEQLSKILPVPLGTLRNWLRYDREFRAKVRQGMDEFNSNKVEKALLQRALGYKYEETTEQDIEVFGKGPLGTTVKVPAHKTITITKQALPDVGALVFYLTNRVPDRWRQTFRTETSSKTETSVEHNVSVDLSKVSKEDLEVLRTILKRVEPEGGSLADPEASGRRARQSLLA